MYPVIETELLKQLWSVCEGKAPNEAVGLLVGEVLPLDGTVVQYTRLSPLHNISSDPMKYFALDYTEFVREARPRLSGKSLILWHSHPDSLPRLSEEDCEVMWAIKLPMLIVSLEYKCAVLYTYLKPNPDGKRPIVEWGKWGKP